ncbi:TVP38/TMEM64 family protein [candidate division WOR-3 bacterium]|nr:TVP38/TMEM64 family protein [candidate division WOR-3 bacterium]
MDDAPKPVPEDEQSHRLGTAISIAFAVLLVGAVAVLFVFARRELWHYFSHPAELRALVVSWGAWAPLGIIGFQVLQVVVAPLPGNVVAFATGYAMGFWPGILWVMLGVIAGAAIDFTLARLLGRRLLRYLLPPERLASLDRTVVRRGTFYVFLLLLIPNPVGDLTYYLAGLTPLPLPLFLVLVLVGRLPSNIIECGLGSGATRFGWVEWTLLGAGFVLLTVLYFVYQRRISALLERWSHVGRWARRR